MVATEWGSRPHAGEPGQSLPQLGPVGPECRGGVRCCGVDALPGRQHHHHRLQRGVGVELGAALHTAGVVGDDTAHRAGALAGRVGPERGAVGPQDGVDMADSRAGQHAHPAPAVEHLHPLEVTAGVHHHRVGQGLPRQAGAAGAEGDRCTRGVAGPHDRGHLVAGRGPDDDLGGEQVVRGVVGHRVPVQRPPAHGLGPDISADPVGERVPGVSCSGPHKGHHDTDRDSVRGGRTLPSTHPSRRSGQVTRSRGRGRGRDRGRRRRAGRRRCAPGRPGPGSGSCPGSWRP